MAVVPMQKIRVTAMKRDRKELLNMLQRRGIVEVADAGAADDIFYKKDTSMSRATYQKSAEVAQQAVEVLDKYVPHKGESLAFLRGRTPVSVQYNDDFYKKDETVLRKAQRILQLQREIAEANAEILKDEARLRALQPWLELPVSQLFTGTKKTAAFVGQLEGDQPLDVILAKLADAKPELGPVHVEIVYASKEVTCLYAMALKRDAAALEEGLRAIGFARPQNPTHHLPAQKQEQLEGRIATAQKTIAGSEEKIKAFAEDRDDFVYLADHMNIRLEKHEVMEKMIQTRHVFVLEGYVPAARAAALQTELESRFECSTEVFEAGEEEDVPVLLKNNRFAEPTESVLEAYSLPSKQDIDPTNVMAFFYYLMFGLMFGDAGYGLIMAGVCLFCLLKFKNMEPNWNKNVRMFFWCGVATVFWGVVFSSYFGDVVTVVSRTFFGREVSIPPLWFSINDEPMLMLVFCMGLGILHLSAGFVLKGVTNAKNGDYAGIIYDTVFPLLVWYPLMVLLAGSDMFANLAGFRLMLPPVVTPICIALVGIALVGIVFTGGRESKRWPIRLMKGAYAVYNTLSGWLSDMLSYSRLLALGLASGVIASVMNQLGAMAGGGLVGIVVFTLVFIAGQSMNFGINVLGAYVHSNRLEYIEFFGKFYEGGGRKFSPFGIHTKKYKISEEEILK